jgi:hypothetical protein
MVSMASGRRATIEAAKRRRAPGDEVMADMARSSAVTGTANRSRNRPFDGTSCAVTAPAGPRTRQPRRARRRRP